MTQLHLEVSNRYKQLACPIRATKELFHTLKVSNAFPTPGGELSVVFVTDAAIAQIHKDFMKDPSATDVITFPANEEMDFAGEIIVSVDHARSQAKGYGESFSRELSLYLIHGWLHLAGYDDCTVKDRTIMQIAEQEAMEILDRSSIGNDFQLILPGNI